MRKNITNLGPSDKSPNAQNALSDFFNKQVDLVFESNLKPRVRPYVFNYLVTLYAER